MTAVTVAFDTLAYANKLKAAGMDSHIAEVQAEAQAEILASLMEEKLVTKEDMKVFEVATKQDVKEVKVDMKSLELNLRQEIKKTEKDLIIKMGAMIFASFSALATLISVLHFH